MGDTFPGIYWALKKECPVRSGAGIADPQTAFRQTAGLHSLASGIADNRILNGYCITSYTPEGDNAGNRFDIPCAVRSLESLVPGGDVAAVNAMCAACNAHSSREKPDALAGCCGFMTTIRYRENPKLEQEIQEALDACNLRSAWEEHFARTSPIWYSFWIESPLNAGQAGTLLKLFAYIEAKDLAAGKANKDFQDFVAALRTAVSEKLSLHVAMAPLGHVDCGWSTVHAHCPRCKAPADLPRWEEDHPSEDYVCNVCHHTFDPSRTFKQEKYRSEELDKYDIEKVLDEKSRARFIRACLQMQGATEKQVQEIFENQNLLELVQRMHQVHTQSMRNENTLKPVAASKALSELSVEVAEGIKLLLVRVPPGILWKKSTMGDHFSPTKITFDRPFYLGKFPVTQAQWSVVMGTNPSLFRDSPEHPVEGVSWLDAYDFCFRIAERLKLPFRIPTDAEWEYACRAGTTTAFCFGDFVTTDQVNFNAALDAQGLKGASGGRTTPAGRFPPNAWGLHDMHGNVHEWCDNQFALVRPSRNKSASCVLKGGSCLNPPEACRSDARAQLRADAGGYEGTSTQVNKLKDFNLPVGFRVFLPIASK